MTHPRRHRGRPSPRTRRSSLASLPLVFFATLAIVASLSSLGTYALWNDTATVTGGPITSGSLDVTVNGSQSLQPWTAFTLDDTAPGESKAGVLTLRNAGTTPFTLTGTGVAGGTIDLTQYTVRVVVGGTANTDTSYPRTEVCSGGTQLFSNTLGTGPATVLPTTASITPNATLNLCVEAKLKTTAPNSAQGKTYAPTIDFLATQS